MIIEKFEKQVERFAKKTAVVTENITLTYEELNRYANRVARAILNLKIKKEKEQILGLLFEHSAYMIIGVLGTLKAGKAYVPLDITYPENRLAYMLENSEAYLLLTNDENMSLARTLAGKVKNPIKVININAPDLHNKYSGENINRDPSGDKLAYILYTSGSTGKPKGVIQDHENVWYYIRSWTERFSISPSDRMTLFSAFSHDGAGQDMFGALLNGATLYPYNILNRANIGELSQWLIDEKITIWHSVPTLYRYFVDTLKNQNHRNQRFPYLRFILLGGEQIREHDIEMYKRFFPSSQLANVYGQTESSVDSIWIINPESPVDKLLIGEPLDKTEMLIVTDDGTILEEMGVGEIVVVCEYLALGYWKDNENTDQVFFNDPELGRLYRTGDLGRLMVDGNIELMGRKDYQVKIRGFRIEVGEIETTLLKHGSIKDAVVAARADENGSTCLCAYYVPDPMDSKTGSHSPLTVSGLREYLSRELPEYMIPTYFTPLEKLPLTPNGKVDKKNLPEPQSLQSRVCGAYAAPNTLIEGKISTIWEEILTLEKLGIHNNFFELGGDSLKAMTCVGRIHREFNTEITILEIFNHPTIKELAEYIEKNSQIGKFHSIRPTEQKEYYDVSAAQKRLYILQRLDPANTGYNLTFTVLSEGNIDGKKFDQTFRKLINRHEILRASFEMAAEKPVQRIYDEVDFEIQFFDLTTGEKRRETEGKTSSYLSSAIRHLLSEFIRPFDLGQSPLMRIGLIKTTSTRYIFMLDIHHIVFDGTSINIFFEELMALYRGKELPALQIQYKDYWEWQNRHEDKGIKKRQEDYWMDVFTGEVPVINLPNDYPRPPVQSFEGDRFNFVIGKKETDVLRAVAKEEEVTLFMVLLAVINVLLMKLSGQEDIVIGTPVSGRRHQDSGKIVGMFINTLALRNCPENQKIFREFLGEIKECTLNALFNQDYPFEDLVEKVQARRDVGRNPLFDVMFILHNYASPARGVQELEVEGLKLEPYGADSNTSMFDMTFSGVEFERTLMFSVEYCTKLFKKETIERFTGYFYRIISSCREVLEKKLSDIDILPGKEKSQLLHQFNNTETKYPKDKTIHELFREQVERTPDHVALVGVHETHEKRERNDNMSHMSYMSYQKLNKLSNQLAHLLKEKGVKPGTIAAIMVKRTIRMVVGLLGILKAGGTYLPLDPEYPEARIKYIIEKSGTPVLVTQKNLINKFKDMVFTGEMIDVFDEYLYREIPGKKIDNRARQSSTMASAYVIYTSGSTGNPKGVMVRHKNVVNFIAGMTSVIDFSPGKSILALTTISFDIFFLETLLPVTGGMRVVIADEARQKDPRLLEKIILHQQVNMLQLTPSRLQLMLTFKDDMQYLNCVQELIVGGEAFPVHLFEQVKEKFPGKIYNVYGPTETTIWSTGKDLTQCGPGELTIGSPIANTRVTIVDWHDRIQPLGVAGELLIGGDGVAAGYLNNVELTAERFINYKLQIQDNPGYYRSYKTYITGDLARWLANGEIEFLGRLDHQVKIRGFRIEVEEIEEQLMGHEGIKEVVVTARAVKEGDNYLAAYIVPIFPGKEKEFDVGQLRDYLVRQLPHYMIPSYFIFLENIPLTPNGKINRQALPARDQSRPQLSTNYAAPGSDQEKMVAQLWTSVLNVDKVGIYDNFFDLGGNSLKLIQLNEKLKEALGKDIPVMTIFRYPTIGSLLQYLGQGNTMNGMTDGQIEEAVGDLEETMGLLVGADGE
jgi:amino acid adenylation domain-containing protein